MNRCAFTGSESSFLALLPDNFYFFVAMVKKACLPHKGAIENYFSCSTKEDFFNAF